MDLLLVAIWSFAVALAGGVLGGLIGHLTGGIDWDPLAAGWAGAVPGAYFGAHLTGRLDDDALLQVITVILVVAGVSLALLKFGGRRGQSPRRPLPPV